MATSLSITAIGHGIEVEINVYNDGVNESTKDDASVFFNGQELTVTEYLLAEDA